MSDPHYDASFKALDLSGFVDQIKQVAKELNDAVKEENERQAEQALGIAKAVEKLTSLEAAHD